jgi:hypothetical protein
MTTTPQPLDINSPIAPEYGSADSLVALAVIAAPLFRNCAS